MATGDKTIALRVRGQANERLDVVDFASVAQTAQFACEAINRALMSSPRATAGSPTGERWTGSITANPTSSSDGLIRVDSPVFVGVDANGGLVIKPNGTALSVAVPSGGSAQQIYLYMVDTSLNTAVRRFLPATGPYTEFPSAIATALQLQANLYVRAGSAGSVVASDAVGGVTTALLFLGIATNTGGAVTFTPAANTLETVTQPASFPTANTGTTSGTNTVTGANATVRELTNAALYILGQSMWKGSDFLTPAAGNNFGAYSVPAGGVDKAFRQALGYITVGDGTTTFGDFNVNGYANSNALFTALLAAMPANGATIILKRGVLLTGWNSTTVALPANQIVEIVGDHSLVPTNSPQITFAAGEGFVANATGRLILRNLHIRHVAPIVQLTSSFVSVRDCVFENVSTTDQGAALQDASGATSVTDLDVDLLTVITNQSAVATTAFGVRISGGAPCHRIRLMRVTHQNPQNQCGTISLADIREDIEIGYYSHVWTYGGSITNTNVSLISLTTTDNTVSYEKRFFHDLTTLTGSHHTLFSYTNVGHMVIERISASCQFPVQQTAPYTGTGPIVFKNCEFVGPSFGGSPVKLSGAVVDVTFDTCVFTGAGLFGDATNDITRVAFRKCTFNSIQNKVSGNSNVYTCIVENCYFPNLGSTAVADFAAFVVVGITVWNAIFERNNVLNFQNVAYAGADSTHSPRIFEVDASFIGSVVCRDNDAMNLMDLSSGNARNGVYLIDISSLDRSSAAFNWQAIDISNNRIGNVQGGLDVCMIARLTLFAGLGTCVFRANTLRTSWSTVTSIAAMQAIFDLEPSAGTADCNVFKFSDNVIQIENTGNTNITKEVLVNAGAGTWLNVEVIGNQINNRSTTSIWDHTAPVYVLRLVPTIILFVHYLNTLARTGLTIAADIGRTNYPNATSTLVFPGFPGVGVVWSGSPNLVSNQ